MIGLGSSITSGVPESKYSVSFDGTDHIDTNQTFQSIFRGSFAISFWIKPNDGIPTNTQFLFGSASSANDVIRFSIVHDGTFMFYFQSTNDSDQNITLRTSSNILSNGAATSWTHVIISVIKPASGNTSAVMYINGNAASLQTNILGLTAANHALFTTATKLVIGGRRAVGGSVGDFYTGGIDEFAIYNIAVDDDERISDIYNSGVPRDLRQLTEDDMNNNLQLYYRMGDGFFDDKANGAIHDQANPGFNAELATGNNSTFSGANDWVPYNPSGTTSVSTGSGVLTVTLSGAGNNVDSGAKLEVTSFLTAGKVYRVQADVWLGTETETSGWRIYLGGVDKPITLSSNQTTFVKYIAITNTSDFLIYNTDVNSSTGTFFIDNVSLKEVKDNPGITSSDNMFSSDTP